LFAFSAHTTGIIYIGFSMGYALQITAHPGGRGLLASMLLTSWAADGAAYFVGGRFGKRRLAPLISPKKSVEGLLGSVVFACLTMFAIYRVSLLHIDAFDLPPMSLAHHMLFGVGNAVLGAAGDLFASSLKRAGRMKDSGAVFAGHGGVLDRFDTFYVLAPLYVVFGKCL
jgi:phosphatidate cytidylyltransferase